jgi:hypothetical protein
MKKPTLRIGGMYSNGIFGRHWSVRQVLGVPSDGVDYVTFKVLAGVDRRQRFTCSLEEFDRWVVYEVARNENSWVRLDGERSEVSDDSPHGC